MLGPDLSGLNICHLQCNAGQDTLSLVSRLKAQNPIGVDISDVAIDFATKLSEQSGMKATFIRSDVFDFFDDVQWHNQFDLVFVSYGALNWLSDIKRWGRGVSNILKLGGRLCLIEFHPTMSMFNYDMVRDYPYSSNGVAMSEPSGVSDYVGRSGKEGEDLMPDLKFKAGVQDFRNTSPSHEFCWGLADVINSLLTTGVQLTELKEYPYSNFCKTYATMREEKVEEGTRWYPEEPMLPMMFSIQATKH
ncbi:hypothetical protein K7432_012223 [Basidiobolus ranarum]|uniref:Methyltransferase domain-containing protein n=1 Tax=Basidiobolus ranarum TaxID=34480 RepID=A0ABR2WL89_9FUNG